MNQTNNLSAASRCLAQGDPPYVSTELTFKGVPAKITIYIDSGWREYNCFILV